MSGAGFACELLHLMKSSNGKGSSFPLLIILGAATKCITTIYVGFYTPAEAM